MKRAEKSHEKAAAWIAQHREEARKASASVLRATPAAGEVMDKAELEEKTWLASKVEGLRKSAAEKQARFEQLNAEWRELEKTKTAELRAAKSEAQQAKVMIEAALDAEKSLAAEAVTIEGRAGAQVLESKAAEA